MAIAHLPQLPEGVKYLGGPEGPDVETEQDSGLGFKVLSARYEIGGLTVKIGWTVDHLLGSFRAPDQLHINFDGFNVGSDHGTEAELPQDFDPDQAFDGITTQVLRSIPMAHARALMRERYEQLLASSLRWTLTPLPTRVESDRDYVHVAMAYIALVKGGSNEPLKRLSEWTNESDDTWSARLRRARARGVLIGKGRHAHLSPSSRETATQIWWEIREAKGAADGGN